MKPRICLTARQVRISASEELPMSSSLPPTPPRQLDETGFIDAARARLEEVYGPRSDARS